MKTRFVGFALLCLLSSLSLNTPVTAAPVRVSGVVFEETNNHPAPNAVVELLRARDGQSSPIAKTRADAIGRFSFAPQNVAAREILVVRTNWTGYTYVAPAFDSTGELAKQTNVKIDPAKVRLSVYQTTTEIVPISFMAHHLAIESKASGLKCVERIIVENPTKKTFLGLGTRRATVLLQLPPNAKNVKLDPTITDAKIEKRGDKNSGDYAVIKPIPPTAYESRSLIIVNYDMDWPSTLPWKRTLNFSHKVQYPTKFFFVARNADEKRLEVTAPLLSAPQEAPLAINGAMETRTVNAIGRPMGGEAVLKPGDDLKIQISSPVNPLFWGFLGFMILFSLAVPAALLRRSIPGKTATSKIEEPPVTGSVYPRTLAPVTEMTNATVAEDDGPINFSSETSGLIESIAKLDEEFDKGELAHAEYSRRRQNLKSQVVEQLLQNSAAQQQVAPVQQVAKVQDETASNAQKNKSQSKDSGA